MLGSPSACGERVGNGISSEIGSGFCSDSGMLFSPSNSFLVIMNVFIVNVVTLIYCPAAESPRDTCRKRRHILENIG